jgi:hypothetical protein
MKLEGGGTHTWTRRTRVRILEYRTLGLMARGEQLPYERFTSADGEKGAPRKKALIVDRIRSRPQERNRITFRARSD